MYDPQDLTAGDVILVNGWSHGQSLLGRAFDLLIDWSTDSKYHHAALVGDGVLIEALWTVTLSPLDKYQDCADAFRLPFSDSVKAQAVSWALSRTGERYGIGEVLLDFDRYDLHAIPKLRHRLRRYTCSALVNTAYAHLGHPITRAPFPSPADLSYSPLPSLMR